jgi:ABC-type protease/lipase transport system fused ATPase/permease subunit
MGYALRVNAPPQLRIAVEGLTYQVGGDKQAPRRIVDDVSFSVAAGVFTVLGPSGSGKSTLRRRVGMVFQAAASLTATIVSLLDPGRLFTAQMQLRRLRS